MIYRRGNLGYIYNIINVICNIIVYFVLVVILQNYIAEWMNFKIPNMYIVPMCISIALILKGKILIDLNDRQIKTFCVILIFSMIGAQWINVKFDTLPYVREMPTLEKLINNQVLDGSKYMGENVILPNYKYIEGKLYLENNVINILKDHVIPKDIIFKDVIFISVIILLVQIFYEIINLNKKKVLTFVILINIFYSFIMKDYLISYIIILNIYLWIKYFKLEKNYFVLNCIIILSFIITLANIYWIPLTIFNIIMMSKVDFKRLLICFLIAISNIISINSLYYQYILEKNPILTEKIILIIVSIVIMICFFSVNKFRNEKIIIAIV